MPSGGICKSSRGRAHVGDRASNGFVGLAAIQGPTHNLAVPIAAAQHYLTQAIGFKRTGSDFFDARRALIGRPAGWPYGMSALPYTRFSPCPLFGMRSALQDQLAQRGSSWADRSGLAANALDCPLKATINLEYYLLNINFRMKLTFQG